MSHLWDRLAEAKSRLAPVQSKYRVLFEDPATPDEPAKVLVPDPNFMAAALAGNVLPPIDTYQRDRLVPDGQPYPNTCLLYTSPSPRDGLLSRMPSSA